MRRYDPKTNKDHSRGHKIIQTTTEIRDDLPWGREVQSVNEYTSSDSDNEEISKAEEIEEISQPISGRKF